jgi:hypothetical protein
VRAGLLSYSAQPLDILPDIQHFNNSAKLAVDNVEPGFDHVHELLNCSWAKALSSLVCWARSLLVASVLSRWGHQLLCQGTQTFPKK